MHQFIVTLTGQKDFTEQELLNLAQENILDATTCIRSIDGTVLINSEVKVQLMSNSVIEPIQFAI